MRAAALDGPRIDLANALGSRGIVGPMAHLRIAVVGHVEHVTLGRTDGVPEPGDIIHLRDVRFLPGGGGGLAFLQLCCSDAELLLFTAFGSDDGGRAVEAAVRAARPDAQIHAARRPFDHPRVVVHVDTYGRRTIIVTADPLQPAAADPLPWSVLADCDAVYFTGADPESLRAARSARRLVVTARRAATLRAAGIAPDVIVGSISDPRENAPLSSYAPPPGALVLTDGSRPIQVIREGSVTSILPPEAPGPVQGDYGAGDSFAGALTYFVGLGLPVERACERAAPYGGAVLQSIDPRESQMRLSAG
ncbi:Ribokinase [Minicystis rosea]|nr:Ribokinase [Minicystis rosea]